MDGRHLAEGGVLEHLHDEDVAVLAPDGTVDEHHLPVDAGDAQPLGGVALDDRPDGLIFLQRFHVTSFSKIGEATGFPYSCFYD